MKKRMAFVFILFLFGHTVFAQVTPMVFSSLVFPIQEKHVHSSSLVELPNGDLLIAWFEGSGERTADDVRIMGARMVKGNAKWSKPFELADTPFLPDCNPVLFLNSDKVLCLVWIAVQANLWEQSILKIRKSKSYNNEGAPEWYWQDNILLKPGDDFAEEVAKKFPLLPSSTAGWGGYAPKYDSQIISAAKDPAKRSIGWMTRTKPLEIKDKHWVLPLYSDGFNLSMMAISHDDGETWISGLPLVGRGPIQPALIKQKNGTIMAFLRDSGDEPSRIQISVSDDEGKSWQPALKSNIPNTASVEVIKLSDGRWALVANDIEDGRYRIGLFLSENEGDSWSKKFYIENNEDKTESFSYPSIIQTKDGKLHVSYSYHLDKNKKAIKYVVIDPLKI
jgi:predicted neuraminidase